MSQVIDQCDIKRMKLFMEIIHGNNSMKYCPDFLCTVPPFFDGIIILVLGLPGCFLRLNIKVIHRKKRLLWHEIHDGLQWDMCSASVACKSPTLNNGTSILVHREVLQNLRCGFILSRGHNKSQWFGNHSLPSLVVGKVFFAAYVRGRQGPQRGRPR